jgi:hypothetical protein
MISTLLKLIKNYFEINQLFSASDIPLKNVSRDALKEDLSRLMKANELSRFSKGLYYLSDVKNGTRPSCYDALAKRYLNNGKETIGFYSGPQFPLLIASLPPKDTLPIYVYTNKATSGKRSVFLFSRRVELRKPYLPVAKNNVLINSFLTYLAITPIEDIEQNHSVLANFIRANQLSANDVMSLVPCFPAKTFSKLLKSDLYRSLWKH